MVGLEPGRVIPVPAVDQVPSVSTPSARVLLHGAQAPRCHDAGDALNKPARSNWRHGRFCGQASAAPAGELRE
eukprot:6114610-Alexandrium_andersonii.AAC.1